MAHQQHQSCIEAYIQCAPECEDRANACLAEKDVMTSDRRYAGRRRVSSSGDLCIPVRSRSVCAGCLWRSPFW